MQRISRGTASSWCLSQCTSKYSVRRWSRDDQWRQPLPHIMTLPHRHLRCQQACNLPPTSCDNAMPRQCATVPALLPKSCIASMGAAVSRSISGIHHCRDLTSVGDACTGAQFTTISPPPVLNAVRAYIHCNHLQYAPTTRASAPALMATLTGAANPPWRITSLAPPCPPRPDATAYPYFLVTAIVRGVTAFTPLSTHHPAFVRPYREGCAHIDKYASSLVPLPTHYSLSPCYCSLSTIA